MSEEPADVCPSCGADMDERSDIALCGACGADNTDEAAPYVCTYHRDSPGWDVCSEDRPCEDRAA